MSDFNELIGNVEATCFDTFGETALYDDSWVLTVIIDKAVPYVDDEGNVLSNINEIHIREHRGLSIENGKAIKTDDTTYTIQRFLRQSGSIKTYEIV